MSTPSSISTAGVFSLGSAPGAEPGGSMQKSADKPAFAGLMDQTLSSDPPSPKTSSQDPKQTEDSKAAPDSSDSRFVTVQQENEDPLALDANASFVLSAFLLQFGTDQAPDANLAPSTAPLNPAPDQPAAAIVTATPPGQKGKTLVNGSQPSPQSQKAANGSVVSSEESTRSDPPEENSDAEDSNATLTGVPNVSIAPIPPVIPAFVLAAQTDRGTAAGDSGTTVSAAQVPSVQANLPSSARTSGAAALEPPATPVLPAQNTNSQGASAGKALPQQGAGQDVSFLAPTAPRVVDSVPQATMDQDPVQEIAMRMAGDISNKSSMPALDSTLATGWRMVQRGDATAAEGSGSSESKLAREGEPEVKVAIIEPKPSPSEHGTGIANNANSMRLAEKMNQNDPAGLQKVPSGERSVSLAEEKSQPSAMVSHSSTFHREGREMPVESAAPLLVSQRSSEIALADGTTSSAPQRIANPVLSEIVTQVTHLRQTGLGTLDVVLKPDRDTEIQLHLTIGSEGHVEVSAQMNRGDYTSLNAQWSEMQRSLSKQGIEVSPLSEGLRQDAWAQGTFSGGFASPDQQRNDAKPNEEELLVGVGAPTASGRQSAGSLKTSRPSNREWWA